MTATQAELGGLFDVDPSRNRLGNLGPRPALCPRGEVPLLRLATDMVSDDGMVVDEANARRALPRELVTAHWGFVLPQTSKRTGRPILPNAVNNARDDKLSASPFWRSSFAHRRCLLPGTAFSEAQGRAPAIHHWFGVLGEDGPPGPLAFAAIWTRHRGPYEDEIADLLTASMITTSPNALVAPVHPQRMPAIQAPKEWEAWLTGPPAEALGLIRQHPAERMTVEPDPSDA